MNELDATIRMLQQGAAEAPERARQVLESVAFGIESEIKDKAPKKTGRMASSIKAEFTGPLSLRITGSKIATYQEFGTASRGEFGGVPYVIRPKRAERLTFKGRDGRWVSVKRVIHPGIPARPFIRPVVRDVMSDLGEKLGQMGALLLGGKQ